MEEVPIYMTLPYELEFRPSAAEPHKIGVWSKCAIRKDELYGPFLGERRKVSEKFDGTYSWEIRGPKGRRLFSIDATNPLNSNWMRYVKSARFYEEQNMIAVQEDRNIFYKALRKIPDGEELLCWYKGDRSSTLLPSKSKLKKSHTSHNGNKPADRIWKDNGSLKRKYEDTSKPCICDEVISLPDHNISLSELNVGLHKRIATDCSVNDTRSRGPVVKLIPLSAEIKLKVHLDLEIHLDSDVKAKNVLPSDEDIKSKRTSFSVNQGLIVGEKSNISICQPTEIDSSIHSETHAEELSKQKDNLSTPLAICPMTKCKEERHFLKKDHSQSINLPDTMCSFEAKLPSDECHNSDNIVFETNKVLTFQNVAIFENQTAENVDVQTYTNPRDYSNGQKIPLVANVTLSPDKSSVHIPVSISKSSVDVDQVINHKNESDSILNQICNNDQLTTTKYIQKKPYKCHLCSKAFRKHVHLKIHSSRVHVKRKKNIKEFVARKRETIRTRSVSYSEKNIDNSNIEKQNDGNFEMSSEKKYNDIIQEDCIDKDSKPPYNTGIDINQNRNILRKPSDQVSSALVKQVSPIVHYVKKKMLQCRCCKKIFKYKSWLTRHMVFHQSPSMASTSKQIDIKKPSLGLVVFEKKKIDQYEFRPDVTAENKECDVNKNTNKSPTGKNPADMNILPKKNVKPFPCSYCGKHFTTNKNCRRHKRLVHNILVRPERTKLTYSNYIIEKNIPSNYVQRTDISTTLQRKTNKVQDIHKISRLTDGKQDSSHISVRLFDPSQREQSDINRCNSTPNLKTKLEWRTSSHRTGPPPAANKCLKNAIDKEDQNIQYHGTLYPRVSVSTDHWPRTGKPDPFIPKKSTHRRENALFNEAYYDRSISFLTANQVIYSSSETSTTNMDTNQPIDLSSRSKVQKNDTNTSSFSGLFSISSNGEETQSTNVIGTMGTFMDTNVFTKKTFNLKTTNVESKCDPDRSYSIGHVGNNGQKHPHSGQNYTTPRRIQGLQSQFEKFKPTLYQFKELTSTGRTSAKYISPTLEAARLQNQMVTVFKPVLAEVEQGDSQKHPESNITQSRVTYSCNVCSLQFLTLHLLSQHISNHADNWPYKCEFCIKLFRTPQDLVFHRKSQHLHCKIASCKTCKCKFANKTVSEKHHKIAHHSTGKLKSIISSNAEANLAETTSQQVTYPQLQMSPTYRCTKCSMMFSRTVDFHSHIIDCALNGMEK